ncbi:MAG: hypothetical protein D6803_02680 [Anaerolineae bacterium]|nr:MAG: hypothetical protein D6803_02680 [Anaerolineae bacterium]
MPARKSTTLLLITLAAIIGLGCQFASQLLSGAPPEGGDVNPATPLPAATAVPPSPAADESAALVPPPPAAAGACANTFYPLVPGNQWIYQVDSGDQSSKISLTVSQVNGNQATLEALSLDSGVTTSTTVDCQDGAILNFPLLLMGFLLGDASGTLQIEHLSGVFAPAYETLTASNWDYRWESNYLASGQFSATVEGETATGTLDRSPLTFRWRTPGAGEAIFEATSVPAGDFPRAIHLTREVELDFKATLSQGGDQVTLDSVLTLTNELWFEPNVGLLRQTAHHASLKLFGVSFPIDTPGEIKLLEFRPATP